MNASYDSDKTYVELLWNESINVRTKIKLVQILSATILHYLTGHKKSAGTKTGTSNIMKQTLMENSHSRIIIAIINK
ncbi:hypothetical protein SAMN05428988_6503 [Chitinophaga sp. YR573]|nr:hypothetical protein SAMN05428988_6503 [Chitinophaga sp. YR573]